MRAGVCGKCGSSELWNVVQMQETTFFRRVPLGATDGVAPIEALVCKACGYTAWYCDRFADLRIEKGRVASVQDERQRCADCMGVSHFLVAELHELPHDGAEFVRDRSIAPVPLAILRGGWHGARGRFALLVCAACGRSELFAWGISEDTIGSPILADPCLRCHAATRRYVQPLLEEGGTALPVAFNGDVGVGEFQVRCCHACGLSDWYARGIEQLRADGSLVIDLSDERPAATPLAGGPYR